MYYLQSRYYNAKAGRFLNADAFTSTGQGILGNNMFAYCRNNPVQRIDVSGSSDEEAKEELRSLLDEYTSISETGFTIDIGTAAAEWDRCIKQLGVNKAYAYMSEYLCDQYYETYGEEFLFSESCVAYEIEYHIDAYMCVKGYDGYVRNMTTYFMSKQYIIDHCKTIDISTNDARNPKQGLMFNYYYGIRRCYVNTKKDPFSYMVIRGNRECYERPTISTVF